MFIKDDTATAAIASTEELVFQIKEAEYHLDQILDAIREASYHLQKSKYHASLAEETKKNLDRSCI